MHVRRKATDVVAGLETQPQAHGRQVRVGGVASVMRRRIDVGRLRLLHGEAQSMVDGARVHLLVAHQAGQNGQTGRVGRRPAVGAQSVGREVEDSS